MSRHRSAPLNAVRYRPATPLTGLGDSWQCGSFRKLFSPSPQIEAELVETGRIRERALEKLHHLLHRSVSEGLFFSEETRGAWERGYFSFDTMNRSRCVQNQGIHLNIPQ